MEMLRRNGLSDGVVSPDRCTSQFDNCCRSRVQRILQSLHVVLDGHQPVWDRHGRFEGRDWGNSMLKTHRDRFVHVISSRSTCGSIQSSKTTTHHHHSHTSICFHVSCPVADYSSCCWHSINTRRKHLHWINDHTTHHKVTSQLLVWDLWPWLFYRNLVWSSALFN